MKITTLASGILGANCYLISDSGHAFIVDPAARLNAICEALCENELTLDGVLLTHGHFDHMMNLELLLSHFSVPVYLGMGDKDFPRDGLKNAFSVLFRRERIFPDATDLLSGGDVLSLGTGRITVISTPGHSSGSVCYLCEGKKSAPFLITGDTLFRDSVGRTDLYGGSHEALYDSLHVLEGLSKQFPSILIYPGHGPSDTLKSALLSAL